MLPKKPGRSPFGQVGNVAVRDWKAHSIPWRFDRHSMSAFGIPEVSLAVLQSNAPVTQAGADVNTDQN
jgi:hypothetical protein